jgi:N-methylhydantoinase B
VREQKVTAEAARAVYGVVIENDAVDAAATSAERDQQRARRRERSRILGDTGGKADLATARRLDDNLVETAALDGAGTVVACRHCAEILGGTAADAELAVALHEGPSTEAGPQIIANPADYVDAPVVFRQYCCPCCWTALYSAVVPADHVDTMTTLGLSTSRS